MRGTGNDCPKLWWSNDSDYNLISSEPKWQSFHKPLRVMMGNVYSLFMFLITFASSLSTAFLMSFISSRMFFPIYIYRNKRYRQMDLSRDLTAMLIIYTLYINDTRNEQQEWILYKHRFMICLKQTLMEMWMGIGN